MSLQLAHLGNGQPIMILVRAFRDCTFNASLVQTTDSRRTYAPFTSAPTQPVFAAAVSPAPPPRPLDAAFGAQHQERLQRSRHHHPTNPRNLECVMLILRVKRSSSHASTSAGRARQSGLRICRAFWRKDAKVGSNLSIDTLHNGGRDINGGSFHPLKSVCNARARAVEITAHDHWIAHSGEKTWPSPKTK
jgi:hypothetical protein